MPQFPFPSKSRRNDSHSKPEDVTVDDGFKTIDDMPAKERQPIKFKSVEPKGKVNRVRISKPNSATKPSKKSPFKDSGLFEDADTIVKFRDDFGKPFALTVLVVGVVALIYWFSLPDDDTNKLDQQIAPLLVQADELSNQKALTSRERIALFKERTELADKLLAFKSRKDAVDRGAELKLKTLATWETLNLENNITNQEITDSLENTSREFINSRNRSVAKLAKVGLSLIRIHGHLEDPDPKFFPEILDQFKLVSSFATDDPTSADNLMKIANYFETRGLTDEANQLFRVIDLSLSTSHNSEIAKLGAEASRKLNSADSLYEQLKAMAQDRKSIDLDKIQGTIQSNTTRETASTARMESILDFLEYMASNNFINETRELMNGMANAIFFIDAGIERTSIKKKFDDLSKRVSMIGTTFNFDGLYSVEGRPISRGNLQLSSKMIVFWSPENQKSIDFINHLSGKSKIFTNRRIQIVAIATVGGESDQQKVVNMSNDTKGILFLTLQQGRTESQSFITRTPIPKLPYWFLLDRQNKVKALNVSSNELGINNDM